MKVIKKKTLRDQMEYPVKISKMLGYVNNKYLKSRFK